MNKGYMKKSFTDFFLLPLRGDNKSYHSVYYGDQ